MNKMNLDPFGTAENYIFGTFLEDSIDFKKQIYCENDIYYINIYYNHICDYNESYPLTLEMLKDAKPDEKKRLIGERLFPKIQVVEPRLAGKITGMLLDMNDNELLVLLSEQRALMNKINEALAVLKDHQQKQNENKKLN